MIAMFAVRENGSIMRTSHWIVEPKELRHAGMFRAILKIAIPADYEAAYKFLCDREERLDDFGTPLSDAVGLPWKQERDAPANIRAWIAVRYVDGRYSGEWYEHDEEVQKPDDIHAVWGFTYEDAAASYFTLELTAKPLRALIGYLAAHAYEQSLPMLELEKP